MRPQQTVPDIYAYARSLASDDLTDRQMTHLLCAQGLHEDSAQELVSNLREVNRLEAEKRQQRYRQYAVGLGISAVMLVAIVVFFGIEMLGFGFIIALFLMYGFYRSANAEAYVPDRRMGRLR